MYCGHEYTTANLKFGLHIEPENEDILKSLKQAQELRSMIPPVPTVPSSIGRKFFHNIINISTLKYLQNQTLEYSSFIHIR